MAAPYLILGGGNRSTKLRVPPSLFQQTPNTEVVEGSHSSMGVSRAPVIHGVDEEEGVFSPPSVSFTNYLGWEPKRVRSSRLLSTRFLPTLTLAALTFTLAPGASLKAQETLQPIKTSTRGDSTANCAGGFELTHSEIRKWVSRSVEVIEQFYGSFPVEELDVFIHSAGGAGVRTGNMHPTGTVGKRLGRRPFGFYGLGA